jgi:radical SAM-linked protein
VSDADPGGPSRLRIRFEKLGKVRFTSHRDVARLWERTFQRCGLPVAWSSGFTSRPQLSFGLALPTGAESTGEYLDVRLAPNSLFSAAPQEHPAADPGLDGLADTLSGLLPEGMAVAGLGVPAETSRSLQQEVTSCCWDLEVLGLVADEVASKVTQLLNAPSMVIDRERKGRAESTDLRPTVRTLSVDEPSSRGASVLLKVELCTQPRGVRPAELVSALDGRLSLTRARRTQQWIEQGHQRWEPLAVGAHRAPGLAPHAMERAS